MVNAFANLQIEFLFFIQNYSEAVAQGCSIKKAFLGISQD